MSENLTGLLLGIFAGSFYTWVYMSTKIDKLQAIANRNRRTFKDLAASYLILNKKFKKRRN